MTVQKLILAKPALLLWVGPILVSIAISTLLWSNLNNHYVWVLLSVTLPFGGIGWVDDYRKVFDGNSAGLSAKWKYFAIIN